DSLELRLVTEHPRLHRSLARQRRDHVAVASLALEDVEHPLEPDGLLDELLQRRAGDRWAAFVLQPEVLGAKLDQVVLETRFVLQVLLRASALHAVERRLRDEEEARLEDLLVVPEEERQQQRSDV